MTDTVDLFVELFSEEIPARMQAPAAEALVRLATEMLAPLSPAQGRHWSGPRRIAVSLRLARGVAARASQERGPRETASEQALAGFLRKHDATREQLRRENGFWVLEKQLPAVDAAALVAAMLPPLLCRLPWPRAMRWGGTSGFAWVRPLRRIVCLLDGKVVPVSLAGDGEQPEGDDGHGLVASDLTEGHRFLSPGAIAVGSADDWVAALLRAHVVADAAERRALVRDGIAAAAAAEDLVVVPDEGLVDEVAGLVEWPVALLGRIDDAAMDLPPEVMQVSMRINQRYFALRRTDGRAAPFFAFVANIIPRDGGATIVAGNERVLRARFADARHFWDLDRTTPLADRVPALDSVTFHARLGTQGERAARIARLAGLVAARIGADRSEAERAGLLCKADLSTGMVGEFPELQGVIGGYYARHDREAEPVCTAIAQHYQPKGPADAVPSAPVAVAVALADKIDTLAGFFAAGEKPGGSGDPFALRRAALGVIRIIRENRLRLALDAAFADAAAGYPAAIAAGPELALLPGFIAERLRVLLRAEGARHDVLEAVSAAGTDPDLTRLLDRTEAVVALLQTADGRDLLAAARRAANILRIEGRKDGPHHGPVDPALLEQPEERALAEALEQARRSIGPALGEELYPEAMAAMAALRAPLDRVFEAVTVNDERPAFRLNRLRLLALVRDTLAQVADFALIEG